MGDVLDAIGRHTWWIVASLATGWLLIELTSIPAVIGWVYVLGNVVGTAIGLRLRSASLEEWGDDHPDRRAAMRVACVVQLPIGWIVGLLIVVGVM